MRLRLLLLALLPALLLSCEPEKPIDEGGDKPGEETVEPEPEPEPEPESEPKSVDPVSLAFVEKGKYDINVAYDEAAGVWQLTTTGTDPYIYVAGLEKDLEEEHRVLSFEYLCGSGIDDLQVFYGKAIAENRSRHFGRIPATGGENWKECACSIASDRISFGWGKSGDNLRLDFGSKKGVKIQIRKFQVRVMNEAERQAYEEELAKAQGKDAEAARIGDYLGKSFPCRITSFVVGTNTITVKATTQGEGMFYLADIAPWESVTETTKFTLCGGVEGANDQSATLPRFISRDGIPSYDRLLSRFAVVKVEGDKHTVCSHARYADEIPSGFSQPVVPKSKKGIGDFSYDSLKIKDLDDLGLGSVTVNIVLNSFVNTVKTGNFTIEHKYGGISYYMDKVNVASLDKVLKECSKRDIVVSAIILNRHTDTSSSATPLMKHPENDGGNFSMPNLAEPKAVNVYASVLDFLSERYSTSTYGRIHHWIMHNEVDAAKEWTNMGDQPEWRYMDEYVKSMRICHNIVHQYYSNASVLISLTHSWAKAENQYASKSLLEDLCKFSAAEGDFMWGVAHHPYPQSLMKPEFWKDDTSATYSADSPYCTFRNLEVISDWMMNTSHWYKGSQKRILFLSENGTNSPSYSAEDLAKQAAGAAWAWKKVSRLDGIDAMQWHNWRDNRAEGGLRIGLRRFSDDTDDPSGPKPAWYVWQAAGTSSESAVLDQYLPVIGVNSWNEIFR